MFALHIISSLLFPVAKIQMCRNQKEVPSLVNTIVHSLTILKIFAFQQNFISPNHPLVDMNNLNKMVSMVEINNYS